MMYQRVEWDSALFGVSIGRITAASTESLAAAVAAADRDGIDCLYQLVDSEALDLLHAALASGFLPYDVRVELDTTLTSNPARDVNIAGVRAAELGDEPALAALAARTAWNTRFSMDPHFNQSCVGEMYSAWVTRGLHSGETRAVLRADCDNGFVVCHFDRERDIGSIELIAVSPEARGTGVGRALVAAGHAAMLAADCSRARVVTQARNLQAQRLYQAMGYRTAKTAWWLHRWRTDQVG